MEQEFKKPLLNEALRLARLYWGYTQKELANLVDVSQSVISEVEGGRKSVSMDLLQKYAKALNIKMSNLMLFAETLDDAKPLSRGKLVIASKALEILDGFAPKETSSD